MSTVNDQKLAGGDRSESVSGQSLIVSSMTFISRIFGLLRDIAFSYVFGASSFADMFFVAFRIPNFFRRLFAEGAFNQAFVPVLVEYKEKSKEELRYFLAAISGLFSFLLMGFVILGVLGAKGLVALFAPGFIADPEKFEQTAGLVRIMFPYIGLISLTAYAGGVLNAHNRFAVPAVTPVLLNLSLIVGCLFVIGGVFDGSALVVLAWAVVFGGVTQLLFQLPSLYNAGLLVRPNLDHAQPGVREVGVLIVPAVLAASVGQINALVNTIIASNLLTGSISWLYYADRLLELPIGMVAIALSTVMLPHMSRISVSGSKEDFDQLMNWGILVGLMLSMPAAVGLYFLSPYLISTLFMGFAGGAMTFDDVLMASYALELFAVALPGFVLVRVLSTGFFSQKNTRIPFRYASVAVAINLIGSLISYRWLGHVGLALSTALSAWSHFFLLYFGLQRHNICAPNLVNFRSSSILVASALIGLGIYLLVPSIDFWMNLDGKNRLINLLIGVFLVALIYFFLLYLLGFRKRHLNPGNIGR